MANDQAKLSLQPRQVTGKEVKKLRRAGLIPVGVFGKGVEPFNAQVNGREFERVFRQAGSTSLIEISMEGRAAQHVFVQEIQRHPITRQALHIDMYVVDLLREVTHDVPVVVVGESPLVERGDAVVNVAHQMISVRALPTDLPHQIDVDISAFTELPAVVHVSDLQLGDKVHVLTPADDVVLSLNPARQEAEEEVVETADEPERVGEDRDEDEGDSR